MNPSLSPLIQPSDLVPLDVQHPQVEAIPSAPDKPTKVPSQSSVENTNSSDSADESVQSLYDPEPIEHLGGNSLTPRGQMLFQRGVASLRAGDIDQSLEIWRQAQAEFPAHAIVAHNLGLAAGEAQQYGEAVTAFCKANELDQSLIISNLNSVCASMSLMKYQARIDEILEQSEGLRKQRRFVEADRVVQQLLNEYPLSSAGLAELSLILVCRCQGMSQKTNEVLAQALQYAQRAIFLDPTRPAGFAALATAQGSLGAYHEALASSQRALELQSRPNSSSRLSAGEHALKAAKIDHDQELARLAAEYADQVIAEEPDNIRAWTLRADANSLRVSDGAVKRDQNLADFERILQLDPTNAHALECRDFLLAQQYENEANFKFKRMFDEALDYLKANENEKALPHLKQILVEEPESRPALSNLSLALRRLKRFDEALPVQSRLAHLDPTPESWRALATTALQLNNYEQANKAYLQVAGLLPDEARSHRDVAITLEKMGGGEDAIPYWRRVLELAPEDKEAWLHLGKNLLDVGCSQNPVNESLVCEAVPALNKAQALDGGNTQIMRQLALGIAEVGDTEMALDYASRVARHDPAAHSDLVPLLTNIQSRRLSQGLASKPLSSDLAPLLMPPRLPVQNTGDPLVARSFSPIATNSVSPLLVAVVGLLIIVGIWGSLQLLGFPYKAPVPPPPPVWNQLSNTNPQFQPLPPSSPSFAPAALSNPAINAPLTGRWQGYLSGDPASLLIFQQTGNTFKGIISIDKSGLPDAENIKGLQIQIEGTLNGDSVFWRETLIRHNPRKIDWKLGEESGEIINRGDVLRMRGGGKDGRSDYTWSFARDSAWGTSSNSDPASVNSARWSRASESTPKFSVSHPTGWTRTEESRGGQKRVSFKAPQDNVQLSVEISPTAVSANTNWQNQDEQLRRQYGGDYRLVSLGTDYLGGELGEEWQFILKRPNETQLRKVERSAIHNGRRYTLIMVAPAEDSEKWLPTFDRIIASFSFK